MEADAEGKVGCGPESQLGIGPDALYSSLKPYRNHLKIRLGRAGFVFKLQRNSGPDSGIKGKMRTVHPYPPQIRRNQEIIRPERVDFRH